MENTANQPHPPQKKRDNQKEYFGETMFLEKHNKSKHNTRVFFGATKRSAPQTVPIESCRTPDIRAQLSNCKLSRARSD